LNLKGVLERVTDIELHLEGWNFRSYIGKHLKKITACVPLKHFSDCEALQNDWDKLAQWEQQWGMQFHPSKCNSMSVTRSKAPFKFNYILKGHNLESVDTAKYLGLTISSNMT
jgi:hypothetical protein